MTFVFGEYSLSLIKYDAIASNVLFRCEITNTCEIYEKKINLVDGKYIIDDCDLLIKYFDENKVYLGFEKVFNEFKNIDELHITIPYNIPYRKVKMNMCIVLDKIIVSKDTTIDLLNRRILLLEKQLKEIKDKEEKEIEQYKKDSYVIPYESTVLSVRIDDDIFSREILTGVSNDAVKFCKDKYYLDNAYRFSITNYDNNSSNTNSKCIMLFDKEDKLVEKYGCNFLLCKENGNKDVKIIRFPKYDFFCRGITGIFDYVSSSTHEYKFFPKTYSFVKTNIVPIYKLSIQCRSPEVSNGLHLTEQRRLEYLTNNTIKTEYGHIIEFYDDYKKAKLY